MSDVLLFNENPNDLDPNSPIGLSIQKVVLKWSNFVILAVNFFVVTIKTQFGKGCVFV